MGHHSGADVPERAQGSAREPAKESAQEPGQRPEEWHARERAREHRRKRDREWKRWHDALLQQLEQQACGQPWECASDPESAADCTYWSLGIGMLPHGNAAAMARIEAMLEFNLLYGNYIRDLDMMLVETGMNRVHPRILRTIGRRGTTSAVLHEVLDMDRGQVSRELHYLEATRHVTLKRALPDRRVLQVELTRQGEETLDGIERRLRPVAWRLMRRLGEREQRRLARAMADLSGILRLRRSNHASANALVPFRIPRLRRAD